MSIAVTDDDWFEALRLQPDRSEVNFWAPSAANFRELVRGKIAMSDAVQKVIHNVDTRSREKASMARGRRKRNASN
jgi:hypothetical protein